MIADYIKAIQDWCKLKISLWNKQSKVIFKQGDIWWCSEKRWVMLNQAKVLDKKRLTNRIGALDNSDFKKVREKFLEFYSS